MGKNKVEQSVFPTGPVRIRNTGGAGTNIFSDGYNDLSISGNNNLSSLILKHCVAFSP
jgi:hypothetical protein